MSHLAGGHGFCPCKSSGGDGQGLPRGWRIAKREDFDRVFKTGRRVGFSGGRIVIGVNGLDHPRLGISVAKRRLPGAVDRNRVKRVIREIFRKNKSCFFPGLDYVFVPDPRVLEAPQRDLVRSIASALARAGLGQESAD